MPDAIGATLALLYGIGLVWGAFHVTRLLSGLVRPARPPFFSHLRTTAVWSVGASSTLAGLAMVAYAMTMINGGLFTR